MNGEEKALIYIHATCLESEDSSKSITKILNGLFLLRCLQLLEWHLFIAPAMNAKYM
jgi:hypothetical protein